MRYNVLFGGAAGQGPNILTHILGEVLVKQGYYAFYSRDYQSLIRGGHNFNVLSFSDKPIGCNDSKVDAIIALDENSKKKYGFLSASFFEDDFKILISHEEVVVATYENLIIGYYLINN